MNAIRDKRTKEEVLIPDNVYECLKDRAGKEELKVMKPIETDIEIDDVKEDYIAEDKADGSYYFMAKLGGVFNLYNKRKKVKTEIYPELVTDIPNNTILVGEIVIKDKEHPTGNFQKLLSRENTKKTDNFQIKLKKKKYPAKFIVFDILRLKRLDLTSMEYRDRRKVLENFIESIDNSNIELINQYMNIEWAWDRVIEKNLEGLVLKRPDSKYYEGRSSKWIKLKYIKDTEVTVIDYEEHPKGITAITKDGLRFTINGGISKVVKGQIDSKGEVDCEVSYLRKTENNKLFQIRMKRVL